MPVNMDQKLKALRQTADEMMSGIEADPYGARRIIMSAQAKKKERRTLWLRIGVPALAALVFTVTAIVYRSIGQPESPVSTPTVVSIAAGDGSEEKPISERADIPLGSVNLSGGGKVAFRDLFSGSSMTSFPMIRMNGSFYRLLNEPQSLSGRVLGQAAGTVSQHLSNPLNSNAGISSNIVLEGETVYRVQGMNDAAVAARVGGDMRVFQRVSVNGQGVAGSMRDLLGSAAVTEIGLSGKGRVTDAGTIRRLKQILADRSVYLSGSCSSTSQGLYISFENGITLQFYVTGNTVMSCGSWSCGEFMEEFQQVAR